MYQWLKRLINGADEPRGPATPSPPRAPDAASEPGAPPAAVAPARAPTGPAAPRTSAAAVAPAHAATGPAGNATAAKPSTRVAPVPAYGQADHANDRYFAWLFGPVQPDREDISPAEASVLAALADIVRAPQTGADLMRRMPGLLPQLLQSLRSENFHAADVARKISSDLVLVAAVLRLANSTALGSGKPVSSIEHAVMVIGQEGLRQLVTAVAFKPIVDLNSGPYTRQLAPRIWEQAEYCAIACRMLAPSQAVEPLDVFLAGLVQNAGLLVSLRMMDQATGPAHGMGGMGGMGGKQYCERLQNSANLVAAGIAQEWRFPPAVIQAVREQNTLRRGAAQSPMGRVLALADYLAKLKVLSMHGKPEDVDDAMFDALPPEALACHADLEQREH
ncbi:HDOD domain-containing protein [Pseudoduganella namucuonensis]|uniref:HD-like signal output (HDOD) domain, no enzymatic activity n=1 Tax=Pseudoduganella namucuonensis TaxID=1035707 RepID=A0A1I7JLN7_9BURK|nr:HDOD domain-containing protein [Pseudoduganella namucuonensis]SFU86080.1 HD-like signal output (HDOD) domain, no enzymatic activity [Pseudoduganella namucuonensis]